MIVASIYATAGLALAGGAGLGFVAGYTCRRASRPRHARTEPAREDLAHQLRPSGLNGDQLTTLQREMDAA